MTREQLEQYWSNSLEIEELTSKIHRLKRNEAKANLKKQLEDLKKRLQEENANIEKWVFAIPDGLTRRIFVMYYLEALPQSKVADKIQMDRSAVSKKITEYLKESHNSQNAQV